MSRYGITLAALLALAPFTVAVAPAAAASSTSLKVEGLVTSVSADSLELKADSGQAMTFRLVATTLYERGAQTVQQSEIKVGDRVKVKYHQEPNGSLKAKLVEILPPPTPLLHARGRVTAVASDRLTVLVGGVAKTFRLTSKTVFSSKGRPVPLAAFKPGVRVRVAYHADPDGSLRAKKVELLPAACAAVRDLRPGWEVVFGQARTARAAEGLARRLAAKGFKAFVERTSCRSYEVSLRVPSKQLARSVAARARRLGLHPTLERP